MSTINGFLTEAFGVYEDVNHSNEDQDGILIDGQEILENLSDEELAELTNKNKKDSNTVGKNKKETVTKEEEEEEDDENDDDEDDATKDENSDGTNSDVEFDIENEDQIASGLFSLMSKKLDLSDIEEEPKTIDEFIEILEKIVSENSIPEYSSEEVKKLDEFVKNGGKLEDYIKISQEFDTDSIDITSEANQKMVVRKLLQSKGFSETQISKKIEKYEDAGILEDEASDALETLAEMREKEQAELLSKKEKENNENKAKQQQMYESVITTIKELDSINDVTISPKEKKELIEYIFTPTKSGLTQFQEDGKDIKNFIASAYFTKNGTSLIDSAKKKGKSEAFKKIQQNLRVTSKNSSKHSDGMYTGSQSAVAQINKLFGVS